jgi:hypothetical protein
MTPVDEKIIEKEFFRMMKFKKNPFKLQSFDQFDLFRIVNIQNRQKIYIASLNK